MLRNHMRGALLLPTAKPLTHSLLNAPSLRPTVATAVARYAPDVVLAYCSGMAALVVEEPLNRLPFVLDMVDVDSAKWHDLAASTAAPLSWIYAREAKLLARFEAAVAPQSSTTTVITPHEAETLRRLAPRAPIVVSPNGLDAEFFRPPSPAPESQDVVFCGVMNYAPNEDAAAWLANHVWPHVRTQFPAARLVLVGANPSARVQALRSVANGVQVTGTVPDVRPYLWSAAVSVAPLSVARGTQNKVLEAVAAGLPAVVTSVVAKGLPTQILRACSVADSITDFAAAIGQALQNTPTARRSMVDLVDVTSLTWEQSLAPLVDALRAASAEGRRTPRP